MEAELVVKRTYKRRLVTPNTVAGAAQRAMFAQLTGASRVVWNAGIAYLNDRRQNPEKYEDGKTTVYSGTPEVGTRAFVFPQLREERQWFAALEQAGCNHILRHPLERLDDARAAAFERLKVISAQRAAGKKTRQKAGFPKFHAKREDESFTVPDGFSDRLPNGKRGFFPVRVSESRRRILLPGVLNHLRKGGRPPKKPSDNAPNIGWIRLDRKIPEGASVSCVVVKRDGRKWFAFLQCDVALPAPSEHSGPAVGLDMNVEDRAQIAASDGRLFPAALGEMESERLAQGKERAEVRRARCQRRVSRSRDIALRKRVRWNGKSGTRKRAESRLKKSHIAEIESRRASRVVVAEPYCVLPWTLAAACEKAGLSVDRLESAGVLRLLADRMSPTRKFFAAKIATTVPGLSLPQWRRAKTALDELLPRGKRRQKFGESKYGVRYQMHRTRGRKASARVKNIRENFAHLVSAKLTRECGFIGAEELALQGMTASAKGDRENPGKNVRAKAGLNREMLDKSFGGLRKKLEYKAAARGGKFVETPYAYTSQACNRCAEVDAGSRQSASRFKCVRCGHEDDAQTNAAKNILAVARKKDADPKAAEKIPPGPSDKTKEFVIAAIREHGAGAPSRRRDKIFANGEKAPRPATGAGNARSGEEPGHGASQRTRPAGGEGTRKKAAKAAQDQSAAFSPPKLPRGNKREITPAKARNRATNAKKESGLYPDSPAKSRDRDGSGGTTP